MGVGGLEYYYYTKYKCTAPPARAAATTNGHFVLQGLFISGDIKTGHHEAAGAEVKELVWLYFLKWSKLTPRRQHYLQKRQQMSIGGVIVV